MTWIEKEVPNVELCKKLKKLGYPQENGGYWWYEEIETGEFFVDTSGFPVRSQRIVCVAPTIRELFTMLPIFIKIEGFRASLVLDKDEVLYSYPPHNTSGGRLHFDGSLPDRLAKMVIWLKQHGYIDFKKEKE